MLEQSSIIIDDRLKLHSIDHRLCTANNQSLNASLVIIDML